MPHPKAADRSKNPQPRPRNYLSRREQLRLLFMVGTLMFVLILMNEARNPKYWALFTGGDSSAEKAGPEQDGEIDTRLQRSLQDDVQRLPGEIDVEGFRFSPSGPVDDRDIAHRRAEKDFWRQQMALLPPQQRSDLPRVLHTVRAGEALDEETAEQWKKTLATLDQRWQEYTQRAMDAVTMDRSLRDRDRSDWLVILHEMQKRWNDGLHDALAAAPDPSSLTQQQREELNNFQELFDELSMELVRDDTPDSRSVEANAWYRLFENLQRKKPQALAQAEAPQVGFRQLFEQPDEYRGKLVRIQGDVRQAFRVQAPKNILGIDQYYVFTIFPSRGPSDPILVYCLEVPTGFPEIKDKDIDREVTLLKEPVEFTGYFFKRLAYPAKFDTMVAPLILAKSPQWSPKPVEAEAEMPSVWSILLAVIGAAALGVAISYIVYMRHQRTPSERYGPAARANPAELNALRNLPVAPAPSEVMATMAQEAESSGDENARE